MCAPTQRSNSEPRNMESLVRELILEFAEGTSSDSTIARNSCHLGSCCHLPLKYRVLMSVSSVFLRRWETRSKSSTFRYSLPPGPRSFQKLLKIVRFSHRFW